MERRKFSTGVAVSSLVATGAAISSVGAAGEAPFATLNEFGALGDGKSDDSDSIQRAFDAAGAGRIALPSAFASKVVFGLCTVADAASSVHVVADIAASTKEAIAVRSAPAAYSRTVAVQWIAIGC